MGKFRVDLEDGRSFMFEGEQPPSQQDVKDYLDKEQLGNYSPQMEAASLVDLTMPQSVGTIAGLLLPHGITSMAPLINRAAKTMRNYFGGVPKEEAVGNFIQSQFGFPASAGERAATTQPNIRAAYAGTGGAPNVPVNDIVKSVDQSLQTERFASNPNQNAIEYLTNLRAKYQGGPDALYTDLIDESQALRREALKYRNDPATAHSLMQARQGIDSAMANISPAARQAALEAKKGAALPDLLKAARAKDPVVQLGNLFERKPSVAQAFGLNTPEAINDVLARTQQMNLSQNPSQVSNWAKWLLGISAAGVVGGAAFGAGHRIISGLLGGNQGGRGGGAY